MSCSAGKLKDLRRRRDQRPGWLQDRIPPRRPQGGRCFGGAAPGRIFVGDKPRALVHPCLEGLLLQLEVTDPGRLAAPLMGDQVRVLTFNVADRSWFGGAQRLDLAVWMATA